MTRIEIPLSKTKLFFTVCGAMLFVVLGFYIILRMAHSQDKFNPLILQAIGFVSVVFFGAIAIFGSKKLFTASAGVVIDEKGIIDNSSGVSIGLIEWKDIKGITTTNIMSNHFLLIHVSNPEKYLARANKAKAKIMTANMKMVGTPISISPNTLQCNVAELEQTITTAFENYKNQLTS